MKEQKVLLKGLSKFVDERNIKKVRLIFDEFHPSEINEEIKDWPVEKAVLLLRLLKEEDASDLFAELEPESQKSVINALSSEEISELFEEMYTDEAIDILEELPANIVRKVLKAADKETRTKINSILRYDEKQVGYHMVVDYIAIPNSLTIKNAKENIRKQINNDDLEIVGNVFIYDKKTGKYEGYITPGNIIAGENGEKIDKFIEKVPPITTSSSMGDAEDTLTQYNLPAVPVVNTNNKLVGVIEADDIIEWFEEASEAAFEQSGVKVSDKPYLEQKVSEMFKARIPWIIALLVIGTLTQIIIMGFQSIWIDQGWLQKVGDTAGVTISMFAVMTAMSLSSSINDAAGNTGSQTSSTLVRAIALGEVGKGSYGKALRKEFIISCLIGASIFITAFIRIIIVWSIFGYFNPTNAAGESLNPEYVEYMMLVALIATTSFFVTIVLGNMVGAGLPIFADKFGIDGAIFSGPVQTTIVDILTILIYFTLTTGILLVLKDTVAVDGIAHYI